MDILASFKDTLAVMHAEQILTRRGIPFETVPRSRLDRNRCGLGILFDQSYLEKARQALEESHLDVEFEPQPEPPRKSNN
ncbi:MAG TPA: DUF3343 domain-containing protein [bacterium]|jgi:hypothetical protein